MDENSIKDIFLNSAADTVDLKVLRNLRCWKLLTYQLRGAPAQAWLRGPDPPFQHRHAQGSPARHLVEEEPQTGNYLAHWASAQVNNVKTPLLASFVNSWGTFSNMAAARTHGFAASLSLSLSFSLLCGPWERRLHQSSLRLHYTCHRVCFCLCSNAWHTANLAYASRTVSAADADGATRAVPRPKTGQLRNLRCWKTQLTLASWRETHLVRLRWWPREGQLSRANALLASARATAKELQLLRPRSRFSIRESRNPLLRRFRSSSRRQSPFITPTDVGLLSSAMSRGTCDAGNIPLCHFGVGEGGGVETPSSARQRALSSTTRTDVPFSLAAGHKVYIYISWIDLGNSRRSGSCQLESLGSVVQHTTTAPQREYGYDHGGSSSRNYVSSSYSNRSISFKPSSAMAGESRAMVPVTPDREYSAARALNGPNAGEESPAKTLSRSLFLSISIIQQMVASRHCPVGQPHKQFCLCAEAKGPREPAAHHARQRTVVKLPSPTRLSFSLPPEKEETAVQVRRPAPEVYEAALPVNTVAEARGLVAQVPGVGLGVVNSI
ncbi:hypothetical protein G7046_g5312 [Stylonectria norvegica]|nr:hypothetical protein G7046_g5312 [Stylonectria norvegica]